ncbi:MAG: hypothetical protein KC931_15635, partial [Candidatus Omnitrophica bacterium]|nr:hypothetical protein [Candidatus Omnitrophota bacterium]
MGRIITGLILILGIVFLVRGFMSDVKRHEKPPTQYIIRDDSRVGESGSEMVVINKNNFSWTDPTFVIKERYRYHYQGSLPPDAKITVPFGKFTTDEGNAFTKDNMLNFEFDIRTATMAR